MNWGKLILGVIFSAIWLGITFMFHNELEGCSWITATMIALAFCMVAILIVSVVVTSSWDLVDDFLNWFKNHKGV